MLLFSLMPCLNEVEVWIGGASVFWLYEGNINVTILFGMCCGSLHLTRVGGLGVYGRHRRIKAEMSVRVSFLKM